LDEHKDNISFVSAFFLMIEEIKTMEKTVDNTTIILSDGTQPVLSFVLNQEKNEVILTDIKSNLELQIFAIKKENYRINIYKYKYQNTLEYSLTMLWVFVAYIGNYYPEYVDEIAMRIKKSEKQVIQELFTSDYFRKKAMEIINITPKFNELKDQIEYLENYMKNDFLF